MVNPEERTEMADSEKVVVGAFTYQDGSVSGPADYMKEQGFAHLRKIESGTDVVFNFGVSSGESPTPIVALLVSIQTDYAGWKGSRDFFAAHSGVEAGS
jgi:hypothetical protein